MNELCWFCKKNDSDLYCHSHEILRKDESGSVFTSFTDATVKVPRCKKCKTMHDKMKREYDKKIKPVFVGWIVAIILLVIGYTPVIISETHEPGIFAGIAVLLAIVLGPLSAKLYRKYYIEKFTNTQNEYLKTTGIMPISYGKSHPKVLALFNNDFSNIA